jgi:hypothetical protein
MASLDKLDSLIPTGSWTLYFHSPEETKWTLHTFLSLGSMKTWRDFWAVMESLNTEYLPDGAFFLMNDPAPPLWENHQNIRGGCYSFRCQKRDAADLYLNYMIAAMIQKLSVNPDNKINGLSISLKRGFNVIKIWNTNGKYHSPSDLESFTTIQESDIIYTAFVQKKL